MRSKIIYTLFCGVLWIGIAKAQVYYPFTVSIVDSKTGQPIKDARLAIKELGYQDQISGSDGKIFFQDVPVGEIHYIVTCTGYSGEDGVFNITTEEKSNTLQIKLDQISIKKDMLFIDGEVIDSDGNDVGGAKVEIRAGNVVKTTSSDESGNYNIEINLDEINYNVTEFRMEITKNDCKTRDQFTIPKNNYIYKEVTIDCSSDGAAVSNPKWKKKKGEWNFELIGCEKDGNTITCHFIVKSNYKDRAFGIRGTKSYSALAYASYLYDDLGNDYIPSLVKIGNKQSYSKVDKFLIANIPHKGSVSFSNISTQASKISLLDIGVWGTDLENTMLQFRDIPIK